MATYYSHVAYIGDSAPTSKLSTVDQNNDTARYWYYKGSPVGLSSYDSSSSSYETKWVLNSTTTPNEDIDATDDTDTVGWAHDWAAEFGIGADDVIERLVVRVKGGMGDSGGDVDLHCSIDGSKTVPNCTEAALYKTNAFSVAPGSGGCGQGRYPTDDWGLTQAQLHAFLSGDEKIRFWFENTSGTDTGFAEFHYIGMDVDWYTPGDPGPIIISASG